MNANFSNVVLDRLLADDCQVASKANNDAVDEVAVPRAASY